MPFGIKTGPTPGVTSWNQRNNDVEFICGENDSVEWSRAIMALLFLYQTPNSRALAPACSTLVVFSHNVFKRLLSHCLLPRPGGSVVSVSDSWPGGCEFDPRLRRLLFLAYFRLSPLQKHMRKVVGGFGKKSCVSTGERKPGNTYASPTTMIWP